VPPVRYSPTRPELPEGLIIIYDGGTLTASEISAIQVPPDELAGFALVPPDEVAARVRPHLGRQIAAALAAQATGTAASLEDGHPAAPAS
jgi:8-oxo-dGTP diphosphatase